MTSEIKLTEWVSQFLICQPELNKNKEDLTEKKNIFFIFDNKVKALLFINSTIVAISIISNYDFV